MLNEHGCKILLNVIDYYSASFRQISVVIINNHIVTYMGHRGHRYDYFIRTGVHSSQRLFL